MDMTAGSGDPQIAAERRIDIDISHRHGDFLAHAVYRRWRHQAELTEYGRTRAQALSRLLARFRRNGHAGRPWTAQGEVTMHGRVPAPKTRHS